MGQNKLKDKERRPSWRRSLLRSACLVLSLLTVRVVALQAFTITSGSMEPTLMPGDFPFVNKAALGSRIPFTDIRVPGYSEPRRGEILVFDPPHEDTLIVVKRLIGMPGDTLEMRDKTLYLNGRAQDEPYVRQTDGEPDFTVAAMLWQQEILGCHADRRSDVQQRDKAPGMGGDQAWPCSSPSGRSQGSRRTGPAR
jgi:signal peptidase I